MKDANLHTGSPAPTRELDTAQYVVIAWARVGLPVRAICLSSKLHGSYLHWVGSASVLCATSHGETCSLCANKWAKRWYAWFLGHSLDTGSLLLAQIPLESYHRAPDLHRGTILGATITLRRPEQNRRLVQVHVNRARPHEMRPGWREPDIGRMLKERYATFAAMKSQGGEE